MMGCHSWTQYLDCVGAIAGVTKIGWLVVVDEENCGMKSTQSLVTFLIEQDEN